MNVCITILLVTREMKGPFMDDGDVIYAFGIVVCH